MARAEALALARRASKVIVAKGKKVESFSMTRGTLDTDALLSAMLGPTGNLRAPAILKGKTLYVGFHEGTYSESFA